MEVRGITWNRCREDFAAVTFPVKQVAVDVGGLRWKKEG
jgi:hypothetical protein